MTLNCSSALQSGYVKAGNTKRKNGPLTSAVSNSTILSVKFQTLQEEQYAVDDIKSREAFSLGLSIGAAMTVEVMQNVYFPK